MILLYAFLAKFALSETTPGFKSQSISINSDKVKGPYMQYHAYTAFSKDAKIVKFSTNGRHYGGSVIEKAFDNDTFSAWEANIPNSKTFHSYLDIEFDKEVTVDRLVFATRRDHIKEGGFPLTATFYVAETNTSEFVRIGSVDTPLVYDPLLYTFNQSYKFQKFRFEYTEVFSGRPKLASCAFIYFYKPESEEVVQARNLYSDYCMLTLREEFNSLEVINRLKSKIENLPFYKDMLQFFVERAIKVINGELKYDPRREFSTDPNTKGLLLPRVGSTREYCYNKLNMVWLGTERIPTGITSVPNGQFHFFVQAEENDRIPMIRFTQHVGHWSKWITGNYLIYRGHTSFAAPNLYDKSWGNAIPGGPIYISNPYYENQQGKNVKVYIEGGDLFPIFRLGDDEGKFIEDLKEYHTKQIKDPQNIQNLIELVNDNVFITVRSSRAYYYFVQNSNKYTPQKTAQNLKDYVRTLYKYEGVKYEKDHPYYDPINEYINFNIRIMQPFAAAYAFTEHVGIQMGGWEEVILKGEDFGWGHAHEIGHMMDLMARTYTETTNNMVANYRRVIYENESSRPDHKKFTNLMSPDGASNHNTWDWMDQIGKILTWWNIETLYPNFWGDMNNFYRYNKPDGINDVNERMVYFSCLVTGLNLSTYYERVGLSMTGKRFTYNGSTSQFKKMMELRASQGLIKEDKGTKFWYFDAKSYKMARKYGNKMNIYDESTEPAETIVVLPNAANKYRLGFLNHKNNKFHLGYEIYEGNETNGFKFISFTTNPSFDDPTIYPEGYVPTYKFRAFDRTLNFTKLSKAFTLGNKADVVKLRDVKYNSLKEAISKAQNNDILYFLDDVYETGIEISNKNLEFRIDPSVERNISFIINKNNNTLLTYQGSTLKIIGREDVGFVFEGFGLKTSGTTILARSDLTVENCYFQNIVSERYEGGAIFIGDGFYKLVVRNCSFANNYAAQAGSCIFAQNRWGSKALVENCKFINNRVELVYNPYHRGGAVRIDAADGATIINCYFEENKAWIGGALATFTKTYIKDCKFVRNRANDRASVAQFANPTVLDNCILINNTGQYGGAFYLLETGGVTFNNCYAVNTVGNVKGGFIYADIRAGKIHNNRIIFNNTDVINSSSNEGSFIYLNSGIVDIYSSNNKIDGLLKFINKYEVHVNIYGSCDNIKLELHSDRGVNSRLITFDREIPDDFSKHFYLSESLREKYILLRSKDRLSLFESAPTFILKYEINGTQYEINDNIEFDKEYQLTIPDDAPTNIAVTGYYYNGKLYDITDKISVTSRGLIIAQYREGGYNIRIQYKDKIFTSIEEYKKGDIITNLSFVKLDSSFKVIGYIYNNKEYNLRENIRFDGKNNIIKLIVLNSEHGSTNNNQASGSNDNNNSNDGNAISASNSRTKINRFAIIGGVVAGFALAAIIVCAAIYTVKRKKAEKAMETEYDSRSYSRAFII